MESWQIVVALIGFFLTEAVIGFFFNYKIYSVTKENFKAAAYFGALATFLYTILAGFTAYIAATNDTWWFILASAAAIALGNFVSALMIPKVNNYIKKKKAMKSEENITSKKSDKKSTTEIKKNNKIVSEDKIIKVNFKKEKEVKNENSN